MQVIEFFEANHIAVPTTATFFLLAVCWLYQLPGQFEVLNRDGNNFSCPLHSNCEV